jgi:2-oxoisovalerate dehydrogenase E1 component alpha subunit
LKCQTLFLCRNNKYAISTPVSDQYASDGIAPRAVSFGIESARVDGNDTLAVLEATRKAREYILANGKPYFIEFMTYRMGDHSTSDNSSLYRPEDERNEWKGKNDPIKRLTKFLKNINYSQVINEDDERDSAKKIVTEALHKCQKYKYPTISSMFDDVYDKLPKHLEEQKAELKQHLKDYGDKYPFLSKHEQD